MRCFLGMCDSRMDIARLILLGGRVSARVAAHSILRSISQQAERRVHGEMYRCEVAEGDPARITEHT